MSRTFTVVRALVTLMGVVCCFLLFHFPSDQGMWLTLALLTVGLTVTIFLWSRDYRKHQGA